MFIAVFGLCHQIEAIDIHAGGANQLAHGAADTEIDTVVHGGNIWASKPLSTGTGLLRPRKPIGYPQDRAVLHAGGTADAKIGFILDFGLFFH
jgi:hypothetical protein